MTTKVQTEVDFLHDINEIRLALGHEWGPEQEPIILCNEREILGAGGEGGEPIIHKIIVASEHDKQNIKRVLNGERTY